MTGVQQGWIHTAECERPVLNSFFEERDAIVVVAALPVLIFFAGEQEIHTKTTKRWKNTKLAKCLPKSSLSPLGRGEKLSSPWERVEKLSSPWERGEIPPLFHRGKGKAVLAPEAERDELSSSPRGRGEWGSLDRH